MEIDQMTPITRPLIRYYGGKWKFAPWVISHFPPHKTFVEVFGGAGSVLLRKPRSHTEIYNDIEDEIVNLFRVMRDTRQADELIRLLRLTPYARTEYEDAMIIVDDPVERARRTIIRAYMGFNSLTVNPGVTSGFRQGFRQGGSVGDGWARYPDAMHAIVLRLRTVIIENQPWEEILRIYDRQGTLFYLDPPYLPSVRSEWKGRAGESAYANELTREDHACLLKRILRLDGMVALSGYHSDLYDEYLSGWAHVEKETHATANGHPRTEVLWLSPRLQEARLPLFDFPEKKDVCDG